MECTRGPSPFSFVPGAVYAPPPQTSPMSWCGAALFVVFIIALIWWLGSGSSGDRPSPPRPPVDGGCALAGAALLHGAALKSAQPACTDPRPTPPHVDDPPLQPTAPLDVGGHPMVASVGGLNLQGGDRGTSLQGAFDMTEAGKEFMQAYNPTGLASVMPAGWRADKPTCQNAGDENYAEWSRYSLSPQAVARSENMKAVLRLSENTRQGLSRTLGQQSLLRNAVTPIGPQPIGSNAFIFQDSSVRQAYIAAATGAFPSVGDMC